MKIREKIILKRRKEKKETSSLNVMALNLASNSGMGKTAMKYFSAGPSKDTSPRRKKLEREISFFELYYCC